MDFNGKNAMCTIKWPCWWTSQSKKYGYRWTIELIPASVYMCMNSILKGCLYLYHPDRSRTCCNHHVLLFTRVHVYRHRLTLISTWISNHMPSKVWDEITYPFSNFDGCIVEVWEWISNFIPHFYDCYHLSMLILKLNNVSKMGPW